MKYGNETKSALIEVRIISHHLKSRQEGAIMPLARSVVPLLSSALPPNWTDMDIVDKAVRIPLNFGHPCWDKGAELFHSYQKSGGRYTGSEKLWWEMVALAEGLVLYPKLCHTGHSLDSV